MKTELAALALCFALATPAAVAQTDYARIEQELAAGQVASVLERLQVAAASGDAQASVQLGDLYRDGMHVPRNDNLALSFYQSAADAGLAAGQDALGTQILAMRGAEGGADAIVWLLAAARQGDARHQYHAASALETFQPDRLQEAIAWYERAAAQDHVSAWTSLGVLALQGQGMARDPERAAELFQRAAEAGDARAANNLGLMLSRGEDLERDYARAFTYFSQAAEADLPAGLRNLSVLYDNGFGVAVDEALAAELLTRARQIETPNLAVALAQIGFPFDERLLEPEWDAALDPVEERAAQAGDPVALYRTAFRYLFGLGVRADVDLALTRFERAAELGLGSAAFSLGLLYANGQAVPQSYRQSYIWFSRAHARGVDAALTFRDLVAGRMTPESLASAQAELSE